MSIPRVSLACHYKNLEDTEESMKRGIWGLVLIAALAISSGCATSAFQTARTNGEGNFQFGVEPGIIGVTGGGFGLFAPSFNLAGRYGVSDSVDIGARIGTMGYEVQTKFALNDHSQHDALALALAPGFTAIGFGGGGAGFFYLTSRIPLLIGIPVGDSEFTLGPRLSPVFIAAGAGGGAAGGFGLSAGVSAGFAARVGEKFWVMPEAALDVPIFGAVAAGGDSAAVGGFGDILTFNAGVALLFGGRPDGGAAPPSAAPPAMQ